MRDEKRVKGSRIESEDNNPFKPEWLDAGAIRNAYRRKDVLDTIKEIFKEKRGVLLIGEPATAKTVIAKQFGLEVADKGYFVFYANLTNRRGFPRKLDPKKLVGELQEELKNLDFKIYVIIEDIHHYFEEFKGAFESKEYENIKFLFVGRPDVSKYESPEEDKKGKSAYSGFESFGKIMIGRIEKDVEESWITLERVPVREILEFTRDKRGFEKLNDDFIKQIEDLAKGSLYVTLFALQTVEGGKPLNSGEIIRSVREYIIGERAKGIKSIFEKLSGGEGGKKLKNYLQSIFKYLSWFSQYELPLEEGLLFYMMKKDISNLDTEFTDNLLKRLNASGDLVKVEIEGDSNDSYWMISHLLLANLINLALTENLDDEVEAYWIYLNSEDNELPGKFPGTLTERLKWWKILSKDSTSQSFTLRSNERALKGVIEKLNNYHKSAISFKKFLVGKIKDFISGIRWTNEELAKEITNQHRDEILSKSLSKDSIWEIGYFIDVIARANKELAREITIQHKDELKTKISSSWGDFIKFTYAIAQF